MSTFRSDLQLILLIACLFFLGSCNRQKHTEIKKAKVGDVEISYYARGSGDPLLMIMGFRGTMAIWDPALLEELEKKYTLILFDNRGVGWSSDTEKDLTTIPQMAEDSANLIKALGFAKVNVLGWSMGSRIALQLAIDHPDVVEQLILCSPNPGGKNSVHRTTDAYQILTAPTLSQKDALHLLFPLTPHGEEASIAYITRIAENIIDGVIPNDLNISSQTVERQVHALKLWEEDNKIYDYLPNIQIPTLVAGGLDDVLDSPENVRIVASRIPFAWSAYFAGAGHNFLSQDHIHFARLVTLFIESNKEDWKRLTKEKQ